MDVLKKVEALLGEEARFTEEEKVILYESCELVTFKKKDFLIRRGEIEKSLYYIESGIVRYWFEDDDSQDITFWFSFEGEFCNAYVSMIRQETCEFNIQALEHVTAWRIKQETIKSLHTKSLATNMAARKLMEEIYIRKLNREIFLLKYKPKDRYRTLLEQSGYMLQRIPLKYLASFLGVTPQSLSRIRQSLSNQYPEV